ncbi:hypothetical protein BDA96_03G102800 [Sorghum bicolor]|uniref:Uncharacterized protein n=2 Tax=Sorghum bicolor TaxID=4558 RepID=A0A921RBJ3_SORBI|nr:hypothetical protein BDA96_03G102800 [Sorghum bicolor]KXG32083.1 hypothetical protein SORBI_3003G097500 [Sorghum bicolor]
MKKTTSLVACSVIFAAALIVLALHVEPVQAGSRTMPSPPPPSGHIPPQPVHGRPSPPPHHGHGLLAAPNDV